MMCRVGEAALKIALENTHARQMVMRGKAMKDCVYVSNEGFQNQKDFDKWIKLSLDFNRKAKASKKKTKKQKLASG